MYGLYAAKKKLLVWLDVRILFRDLVDDARESNASWVDSQHPFLTKIAKALASLSEKVSCN